MKSKGLKVKSGGRKWSYKQILAHSKKRVADLRRKGAKYRAIDDALTRHILKGDKAPLSFIRRNIRKVQDATTKKALGLDKKLRKKGLKLPWLLIAIAAGVIVVACFIIFRRPLETEVGIEDIIEEDFRP